MKIYYTKSKSIVDLIADTFIRFKNKNNAN
ncbi:hypothetical protein BXY58_1013 [Epilithonimonas arachidiradicis]|uniref:Uncharacterized protein n=1 Tax=Epilithonimonas arachidiradicis TaxID=1617282 RepID=A0A420DC61_9FLAO|nr:hypothetical protein BXY58_1013 [Epilithonimonas arachidiradicis]